MGWQSISNVLNAFGEKLGWINGLSRGKIEKKKEPPPAMDSGPYRETITSEKSALFGINGISRDDDLGKRNDDFVFLV